MDSDSRRIYMLEVQVAELQRQLKAERFKMRTLEGIIRDTVALLDAAQRRINKAETWGRAVMWSVITLGGFATQFTQIVNWLKP